MLSRETINLLFEKLRFNLSLEEIILNTRRLANFMLNEKQILDFIFKPLCMREIFETKIVKEKVLTKSHQELGMNKSTLWYQKKRLQQTGSLRVYNKTKHYLV